MTLAEQLVSSLNRAVPEATFERARSHVLDWVGCVLGAAREPLAQQISSLVSINSGQFPSFGIGPLDAKSARTYAISLGNLLEMDDLVRAALVHPGPVVVPTAIYTGLELKLSWKETLLGIIKGYEAAARLGVLLDQFHYSRWHPTTTVGVAAAAITASSLRNLNASQTVSALSNALSVSGGLWHMRHHDVSTKQWNLLHAVNTGRHAAEMAEMGFTGSSEIIEGPQGWLEVLSENLLPKEMIQDEEWLIHQVSFKPWPACRHCHAAIDAAIALHKDFDHDEACQVVVQTYSDAIDFCDRPIPVTPAQGRFSLQHCVSVGLLKGDVSSSDFTENRLHDSQIEALRKNVRICEDPSFTQAYPNHFGSAVKVMNSNGKKKTVKIADAKGDPEWPLKDEDLLKKFYDLAESGGADSSRVQELAKSLLQSPLSTPLPKILLSAP